MPLGFEISCKACLLFLKKFSGDLFFDALTIGLFEICVFMDQTNGSRYPWDQISIKHSEAINIGLVMLPLVMIVV